MWYLYTKEFYSVIKNKNNITCRKMDASIDHHIRKDKSNSER